MPTHTQSDYKNGFTTITAVIVATAVIGIGAGILYVSSNNRTKTDSAATSTATTTDQRTSTSSTEQTGTSSDDADEQSTKNQTDNDNTTPTDTTLTDTFRGHEFTASVSQESDNRWNYNITGSLPNPCWSYSVETQPISPVPDNDQEIYRIRVTANPPADDEMCAQTVQEVEESGNIQDSTTDVKFELEVRESGELPVIPS